jgi:hypothetical protein
VNAPALHLAEEYETACKTDEDCQLNGKVGFSNTLYDSKLI